MSAALMIGVLLGMLLTLVGLVGIPIAGDWWNARRRSRKYPLNCRTWRGSTEPEQEEAPITTPLEELGVTEICVPSLRTRHTMHRIRLRSMGKGTSPSLPAIQIERDTEGAIYEMRE